MPQFVIVDTPASGQTRVTFTSAEVGNGNANDSGTQTNQDGGLAVRVQAEGAGDTLTGPVSRYTDEDIVFAAEDEDGFFDVRDLVSGVQRGDRFASVQLGTSGNDLLTPFDGARPAYINGGQGDDTILGGNANDFLVGGAGNDRLQGKTGDDSLLGGGGNDIAVLNVSTDGADTIDLGDGADRVEVSRSTAGQVRLSFTSAEVGNGSANDGGTLANQDGGLAVRVQAENGSDGLTGPISRTDDEGITFVAGTGVTFDVRDLVSGVQRGDQFRTATLGTSAGETLTGTGKSDYINAGAGNDLVRGLAGNDFLVGGAGNDTLEGGTGADGLLGGAGDDIYSVDNSADRVIEAAGGGNDRVYTTASYTLAAGQEIELLHILASTGSAKLNLTGNAFGQTLVGNAGDNVLDGRGGADVLTSGAGADTFVFSTALGSDNVDRITDFSATDTIRLSASIFTALSAGELDDDAFKDIGTGGTVDGSDRIIYDSRTGALSYDADGSGSRAAVQFATLDNKAALSADDFLVA